MRTEAIPIEKLTAHESAATVLRTQRVPSDAEAPILVKPIPGMDLFHIRDGTNRAFNARESGQKTVNCVVGTPDFSERRRRIAELRVRQSPTHRPIDALRLVADDDERQDLFFRDTDALSPQVGLTTVRGNVVYALFTVRFGDETQEHFLLPRKTRTGGIFLDPAAAMTYFRDGVLDPRRLEACWGDASRHDPAVLPAYLEVSEDGQECYAGGFHLRRYYLTNPESASPAPTVAARGVLERVEVEVLYPNGNVYRGPLPMTRESVMCLWSDGLVSRLADQSTIDRYNQPEWWRRPTTLVFNGAASFACAHIEHSCGCTCGNCD